MNVPTNMMEIKVQVSTQEKHKIKQKYPREPNKMKTKNIYKQEVKS